MKPQRTQTTFTFTSKQGADLFASWLRKFQADMDYGCPRLIDKRQVSAQDEWCVEYIYDNNRNGFIVIGVAKGIEHATKRSAETIIFKCLSRNTAGVTVIYDFIAADGECWRCERVEDGSDKRVGFIEEFKQGDMIGVPVRDGIPQWSDKFSSAVRLDSQ